MTRADAGKTRAKKGVFYRALKESIMWQRIFITVGCLGLTVFSLSFSKSSDLPDDNTKAKVFHVDIYDAKGDLIGDLQESENGKILLLSRTDGQLIPCGSWDDKIKQRISSPEGQIKGVVYVRNCGATTDFSTCIDLARTGDSIEKNDPNTIFVMKGDQSLKVTWENPQKLLVQHPKTKKEHIYKQKTRFKEITIEYRGTAELAKESQYIELGNFNYGLTGVANGYAEETLLRIAGWAQEKSRLYKKEWGHWYADLPYGDDPNELKYIKQGFEYFKLHRDEIERKTDAKNKK